MVVHIVTALVHHHVFVVPRSDTSPHAAQSEPDPPPNPIAVALHSSSLPHQSVVFPVLAALVKIGRVAHFPFLGTPKVKDSKLDSEGHKARLPSALVEEGL